MRVVLKHLLGRGGTDALTKPPSGLTPCPALTPGSLSLDWYGVGGRMRRTWGGRPQPVLHPSATPGVHSPHRKKEERGADLAPMPGPRVGKERRPPGEEGEPAAPLPLRLLRALNFTECGTQGAQRREELRRESRAAARGLQASRPRSSGQQPTAGEGQPPPAFPGTGGRRKGRASRKRGGS